MSDHEFGGPFDYFSSAIGFCVFAMCIFSFLGHVTRSRGQPSVTVLRPRVKAKGIVATSVLNFEAGWFAMV
jgi:hypothetical protein